MMILEIIKEILDQYRNNLSLENLKKILISKKIDPNSFEVINHSNIFSANNGLIFIKSSLFQQKELFFSEFEDYLRTKIQNPNICEDIINNFKFVTPDMFIIEWMNASLERKIYIFELLYSLNIKPKRIKDRLKKYFTELIDFYTILTVYSLIFIKNNEDNINESIILFFKKIEKLENILKDHIFNILTIPDVILLKIENWEKEFKKSKIKINLILEEYFNEVLKYSTLLLKRVIKKEINNFDISLILSRYDFKNFYDWLIMILEKNDNNLYNRNNLFNDLNYL